MAKTKIKVKSVRVSIILECTSCVKKIVTKKSSGISRYNTQKNRSNTPNELELKKFCRYCKKHTTYREVKN